MLTIELKIIATELMPGLKGGTYSIGDGSTVLDLLVVCEKENGLPIPEANFEYMYPLFNSKPVRLETALTENGTLHLCRAVAGG